jgi:hypothetical protein
VRNECSARKNSFPLPWIATITFSGLLLFS